MAKQPVKPQPIGEKKKSILPLIYLIVALLGLRWTLVEPYVVPTGSMEPTLKPGDRLYALKCAYDVRFPFTNWVIFRTGKVERGDVILFTAPHEPDKTFVKRAIALPGDRVQFKDGSPIVNGEIVPRAVAENRDVMYDIEFEQRKTLYIETIDGLKHHMILDHFPGFPASRFRNEIKINGVPRGEVVVPEGMLIAVGDNRDHSSDSRDWGFVPMKNLKGQAMFIWYSSRRHAEPARGWPLGLDPMAMFKNAIDPRSERVGTLIQ